MPHRLAPCSRHFAARRGIHHPQERSFSWNAFSSILRPLPSFASDEDEVRHVRHGRSLPPRPLAARSTLAPTLAMLSPRTAVEAARVVSICRHALTMRRKPQFEPEYRVANTHVFDNVFAVSCACFEGNSLSLLLLNDVPHSALGQVCASQSVSCERASRRGACVGNELTRSTLFLFAVALRG